MTHETPCDSPVLYRGNFVRTESDVRGRIGVEAVYADEFIIGARGKIFAIRREAYGMDSARVIAYGSQLLWFDVVWVVGVEDGLSGPYSYVTVASSCHQSRPIGRDVAAVNFKVFEITYGNPPY